MSKRSLMFLTSVVIVLALMQVYQTSYLLRSPNTYNQLIVEKFMKQHPDTVDEMANLIKVIDMVKNQYVEDKTYEELLTLAMKGVPSSLDPHSHLYVGPLEVKELTGMMTEPNYFGIGAQISEVNKYIFVNNVFTGSPAEKAGLGPGDMIVKINGQDAWGIGATNAVELIRGKEGTSVTIEVKKSSSQKPETMVIVRGRVVVLSLESSLLKNGIGYIKINSFDKETAGRLDEAMGKLKNSSGLIIDLRNNPGGLVDSVSEMLGYFLGPNQAILTVKSRNETSNYTTKSLERVHPKNIVVLINNNSASASEIMAGNFKDYKLGTLVGVRTYGKATVQSSLDLDGKASEDSLALKITIAHYFLPDGTNVSKDGVVPDVELEQPDDFKLHEYRTGRDAQFQKAVELLTK